MNTTQELLNNLVKTLGDQFADEVNALPSALPFNKKVRECLIDSYRQGLRSGVNHTVEMLGIEVLP